MWAENVSKYLISSHLSLLYKKQRHALSVVFLLFGINAKRLVIVFTP